jgi:surface protein
MNQMFYACIYLKALDISNFNTAKVTNMYEMFYMCEQIESLDLSNFNTAKVTSMGSMFNQCKKLKSLDLSSFDTKNVTAMSMMFYKCSLLTIFEPFNQWAKATELSLSDSIITPLAVHQLIERASSVEDGAVARTLILNATTKTNWQNSEYYEADQAMATEKLITIQ